MTKEIDRLLMLMIALCANIEWKDNSNKRGAVDDPKI